MQSGCEPRELTVYPIPLQQRLPIIPIPLRQTDEDVPLDLQALSNQAYEDGEYESDIDYTVDPIPPLGPKDARWADALLRKKGLRPRRSNRRNGRSGK